MKIQIKKRVGTKWRAVGVNKLVGKSILSFILESDDDIIAALFQEDDTPVAFIANEMSHLDRYKGENKLLLSASDLKDLIGTDVAPPLIAKIFPGSALVSVEVYDEKVHDVN